MDEIIEPIRTITAGKYPGHNKITPEIIKNIGENSKQMLKLI